MKAVIQRVLSASIAIDDEKISEIGFGLLIFLGIFQNDLEKDIDYMVNKTAGLRIFNDPNQHMNLCVQDVEGEALVVSQFTLCADIRRGRRPSFIGAANPQIAEKMYEQFCHKLQLSRIPVSKGKFGAKMEVSLVNDGPVTIVLNSLSIK